MNVLIMCAEEPCSNFQLNVLRFLYPFFIFIVTAHALVKKLSYFPSLVRDLVAFPQISFIKRDMFQSWQH